MASTYCVVLRRADEDVEARARLLYPPIYPVNDKCFLVRAPLAQSAGVVAQALGVRPASPDEDALASGVVFSLNGSYAGFYEQPLWDWLKEPST